MSKSNSLITIKGTGFCSLLTIAFIILKLCKVIEWSWVWILSPLWISAGLLILFLIVVGIIYFIYLCVQEKKLKNKKEGESE